MKFTIKTSILLCFILAFGSVMQAQKLERQLISSYGQLSSTLDGQVSATGGELIVTSASTATVTLTQGFQQANEEDFVGVFEESNIKLDISLYPNPTTDKLKIDIFSDIHAWISIDIFDVSGQQLLKSKQVSVSGVSTEIIDFSSLPDGQYFILFKDEKGKLIRTFGIQKIKK